jgi:hypothetical protein
MGGDGTTFNDQYAGAGGSALGGAIYVAGGSASVTNTTFSSNGARGGKGANGGSVHSKFSASYAYPGGPGGGAIGGAIYAIGAIELRGTTITQNSATGGAGGSSPKGLPKGADGMGQGGGIYFASAESFGLDAFTQANTRSNTASTSDNDIFGSFTILG